MESYPLQKVLKVMKPNKFDLDNPKHKQRLEEMLDDTFEWGAEEKIDGCHYTSINGRFFSTRISSGKEIPVEKTANFPHITNIINALNMPNLILDGEITIPGKTSQYVTRVTGASPDTAVAFQRDNDDWVQYKIFDILRMPNGQWLNNIPYYRRRKLLEQLLNEYLRSDYITMTTMKVEGKREFLNHIYDYGGEGIVLKKLNGLYVFDKTPMWNQMKVKKEDEADVVVMDFLPPNEHYTGKKFETHPYWMNAAGEKTSSPVDDSFYPVTKYYYYGWIGSVVIGQYKDGILVKRGSSSGMDEETRKDMTFNPEKYIGRVAKIKYMEKTEDDNYRHPKWIGIHADKNPKECIYK